jgi:hypothetical protein
MRTVPLGEISRSERRRDHARMIAAIESGELDASLDQQDRRRLP